MTFEVYAPHFSAYFHCHCKESVPVCALKYIKPVPRAVPQSSILTDIVHAAAVAVSVHLLPRCPLSSVICFIPEIMTFEVCYVQHSSYHSGMMTYGKCYEMEVDTSAERGHTEYKGHLDFTHKFHHSFANIEVTAIILCPFGCFMHCPVVFS